MYIPGKRRSSINLDYGPQYSSSAASTKLPPSIPGAHPALTTVWTSPRKGIQKHRTNANSSSLTSYAPLSPSPSPSRLPISSIIGSLGGSYKPANSTGPTSAFLPKPNCRRFFQKKGEDEGPTVAVSSQCCRSRRLVLVRCGRRP